MVLVVIVMLLTLTIARMSSIVLKYESPLGGLNNLVEQGEAFLLEQLDARPNPILLASHIEQVKDTILYSRPRFASGPLEVGESFETINWRVVRVE